MVKNYLFSAILLIAFSSIFAQSSPDSILVKERNDLFQTYSNDKATKPDPKKEDLMTQVSSLENIINKDNVMIDSLLSYSNSMKVLMERIDTLAKTESSLTEGSKKSDEKVNSYLNIIYGLCGAVVLLIVLLIVLFVLKGKSEKTIKTKLAELEAEKLKFDDELKSFETKRDDAESFIKKLTFEKDDAYAILNKTENAYNESKTDFQMKTSRFENETADLNSKLNQLSFEKEEFHTKANTAESKLFALNNENNELRNKIYELESSNSNNDLQNKESYFQRQLDETTNVINQLVLEKSELESKIREMESANVFKTDQLEIDEFQARIDEQISLNEKIVAEKTEAEEKTAKLEADYASLADEYKWFKDDYLSVKEKLVEREELMNVYRKENNADFYNKIDEIDLKVIKIEKLDKLSRKEVITKEEYDALKQKFLSDF